MNNQFHFYIAQALILQYLFAQKPYPVLLLPDSDKTVLFLSAREASQAFDSSSFQGRLLLNAKKPAAFPHFGNNDTFLLLIVHIHAASA